MTLSIAMRVGDELVRRSFWSGDRCNWIGPAPGDPQRKTFRSLGPALYDGTAGLAWFNGALFTVTGEERFRRTALGAIRRSLDAAHDVRRSQRWSFYDGAFGIAFTAVHLGRGLEDRRTTNRGIECLKSLLSSGASGAWLDLVLGTAGAIIALPILGAWLRDESLTRFAGKLADRTIERGVSSGPGLSWRSPLRPQDCDLTGLSHGTAGIGFALAELFGVTGRKRFRDAALRAFAYERSCFSEARQNWPDYREVSPARRRFAGYPVYWCHGAAGIALSRMAARKTLAEPSCEAEARIALRTTVESIRTSLHSERDDGSLCHGLAGNAAVAQEVCSEIPDAAERSIDSLLVRAAKRAATLARRTLLDSPALFTGLAGAGYANLRLHDASIPSVLLPRREHFV